MPRVPHLKAEWRLWQEGKRLVVGVDEVGMGALCAPVFAAAVLVRPNTRKIAGVRDSKTLSPQQRDRLVAEVRRRSLAWGVGAASVAEIERLNILHASHLAMRRALARIPEYDHVLVDGRKIVGFETEVGPYTSIVDGDASSYAIACASIIAKVTRDRLMALLAARYPGYGWEHNAGYATRDHVEGLQRLGITPFHRRGYQRIRAMLEGEQLAFDLGEGLAQEALGVGTPPAGALGDGMPAADARGEDAAGYGGAVVATGERVAIPVRAAPVTSIVMDRSGPVPR